MFCMKKGRIEPYQLPQCEDALAKHILQANILTSSCTCFPAFLNPHNYGWRQNDDSLTIAWMEGAIAPEAILGVFQVIAEGDATLVIMHVY